MSGIAAMFMPDGRPADPAVLTVMLEVMKVRGPHGRSAWNGGQAALGFLAFHSTPEAVAERQPRIDSGSGRVLVFDGRLDNRDELFEAVDGRVSRGDGDAAYAAAAFDRWGADAPAHFVGDFALVLWDPSTRQLLCARDVMGVRPLCYANTREGALLVASEIRALLATGLVDDRVNEGKALELLAEGRACCEETLYSAIRYLPPARSLTAGPSGVAIRRYWDFDPGRTVRYARDEDYVDHARHLLVQAVHACARTIGRTGILLSGGMDSSSVAALAAAQGINCEALSVVFPARSCDESRFIEDVTTYCGVPSTRVAYAPQSREWYERSVEEYADVPDYPNSAMFEPLREHAARSGTRVLLTGYGGDEWFTGSRFHYADWLRAGALFRVARQAVSDAQVRGLGWSASAVVRFGAWPMLPAVVRAGILHARPALRGKIVPDWIGPEAAARAALESRIAFKVTPREGESHAQAEIRSYASGMAAHSEEMEDRAASRAGVEQRHPFYDRRLMEFAYALPEDQRWRGAYIKRLLRTAVHELPDSVRWRTSKAEFSPVYLDAIIRQRAAGLPRLVERGWITPVAFDQMSEYVREAVASNDRLAIVRAGSFWILLAIEQWLEFATMRSHYGRYNRYAEA